MGCDVVPITGSSLGLTIDFAATLLLARSMNNHFFSVFVVDILFIFCLLCIELYFVLFSCYAPASATRLNKEFTILTYLF